MKRDDTLWKSLLEDIFDDFLRFFYEDADNIFDFSKGFEFLDKELEELFPYEEDDITRFADKLTKTFLKIGSEKWFLVHVEVQGYKDKNFEERMFSYFYRIRDRFKVDITAWVIFTDGQRGYHPKIYKYEFLGTKLTYEFNTYKVIEQDEESLRKNDNPFAIVILTVLLKLKMKQHSADDLISLKLEIAKNLLKRGIAKEKVRVLMNFLRYYVRLEKEENEIFENKLIELTGKTSTMGLEEFLLERERKTGIKQGIEQGIEQGVQNKTRQFVLNLYAEGFSDLGLIARLADLSIEQVQNILREENSLK
jgi:predicted transposase/invertase (TIGR01784 family)